MQGASGFGAGLQQAGNAIASAIEAHKRVLANAKASELIFDNNPEIQEMYSGTPEQFKALSAQDKASFMQGAIANYHIKQASMQQKEGATNLALKQQQLQDLQTQGPAQTRFYEDISKYGQTDLPPDAGGADQFQPANLSQTINTQPRGHIAQGAEPGTASAVQPRHRLTANRWCRSPQRLPTPPGRDRRRAPWRRCQRADRPTKLRRGSN